ncbi:4'-phosphopantetheinyl transferase superfamily protein [Mycoplasma buteonis]|uniref:4'-phosphopantetheinyl transferase superfamily protein n=1 Tax=Mycoplasma buteonis TaxID=171280 RepID=UPI00055E3196|nr:4'-phosphopantetheinyl transferase superfamily protein [Mycoplasma buteonis]
MKHVGVDLTTISRFENIPNGFEKRFLSKWELEQFYLLQPSKKALFLARSWAIKEAIFKANNQYHTFTNIELRKKDHRWTFKNFEISISHEKDLLIAFVVEK